MEMLSFCFEFCFEGRFLAALSWHLGTYPPLLNYWPPLQNLKTHGDSRYFLAFLDHCDCTFRYFRILLCDLRYFWVLEGTSGRSLLGTSWYFLVLWHTSGYFKVTLGTLRYFWVLWSTSWYFEVTLGTSRYLRVLWGTSGYSEVTLGT